MRTILGIWCDSRSYALHLQGHGRGRSVSTDCQCREADFGKEKNVARDSCSADCAVVVGVMFRPKRTESGKIADVPKANRRNIMIRGLKPEAKIVERERRRTPRYPFIASAELIEEKADVRIASRVSELSLHGCYLDMMNPFPHGDSRPREDRRWRCIFPSQGQDHLLANEYGRRRELPPDRARIPGGAGALAGRGGERFPEAGRVIVPQCGAASTPVPTQRDVAAESTTNDN